MWLIPYLDQNDVCAGLGERDSHGSTNASSTARHDRRLARQ
jgi:hypothetical protein